MVALVHAVHSVHAIEHVVRHGQHVGALVDKRAIALVNRWWCRHGERRCAVGHGRCRDAGWWRQRLLSQRQLFRHILDVLNILDMLRCWESVGVLVVLGVDGRLLALGAWRVLLLVMCLVLVLWAWLRQVVLLLLLLCRPPQIQIKSLLLLLLLEVGVLVVHTRLL